MQTEAALRMAHAGLEVTRVDADPSQLAGDPDFPGMEAPRTTLPVVAGAVGLAGAPRRVIIAGHIDTVSPGQREDWSTDPFGARAARRPPVRTRLAGHEGRRGGRPGRAAGAGRHRDRAARRGGAGDRAQRGGRRRRHAGRDPGRLRGRDGGHHRAHPARDRDRAGRGDHLPADGQRPLRPRRLPPQGRLRDREAARHPRRAAGRRARTQRERAEPGHARSRPPLPHQPGPHIRRRLVVDRSRPGHRRGALRRARRRDAGAGRAGAARRRGRRLCRRRVAARPPRLDRDHRRALRLGGRAAHPRAALEPGRDRARRAGQAARLRGRSLRRRHAAADQRGRRPRPCSTAPAIRSWPTPPTSTSSSRTWRAVRGCWRCG